MGKEQGPIGFGGVDSVPPEGAEEFAASLKRRGQAAKGLAQDLVTEVPLLYGSPGAMEPHGDPGIVLVKLHQEERQRLNGGGVSRSASRRSDVSLPFERTMEALAVLIFLWILFGSIE